MKDHVLIIYTSIEQTEQVELFKAELSVEQTLNSDASIQVVHNGRIVRLGGYKLVDNLLYNIVFRIIKEQGPSIWCFAHARTALKKMSHKADFLISLKRAITWV